MKTVMSVPSVLATSILFVALYIRNFAETSEIYDPV